MDDKPGSRTTDHWAVTVERNGQSIVTIESNCLSGRSIDKEDERVIRIAAAHLLAFIGDSPPVVSIVAGPNDGEGIFPTKNVGKPHGSVGTGTTEEDDDA